VDQNGNPVMGQGGAIAINGVAGEQGISVNQNGEIFISGEIVDTLDIVTFKDPRKLERDGQNLLLYKGETMDELPAGQVAVEQRALEKSNTGVVDEMVQMIDTHRMFETFTKSMMSFDELDSKAINEVGKLR